MMAWCSRKSAVNRLDSGRALSRPATTSPSPLLPPFVPAAASERKASCASANVLPPDRIRSLDRTDQRPDRCDPSQLRRVLLELPAYAVGIRIGFDDMRCQ